MTSLLVHRGHNPTVQSESARQADDLRPRDQVALGDLQALPLAAARRGGRVRERAVEEALERVLHVAHLAVE